MITRLTYSIKWTLLIVSLAGMHVKSSGSTKLAQSASFELPGLQQPVILSVQPHTLSLTKSYFPFIKKQILLTPALVASDVSEPAEFQSDISQRGAGHLNYSVVHTTFPDWNIVASRRDTVDPEVEQC